MLCCSWGTSRWSWILADYFLRRELAQIGLDPGVVRYESADKLFAVDGFDGVVFHDTVNGAYDMRTLPYGSRLLHPYTCIGLACGTLFIGLDGSNESNHVQGNYLGEPQSPRAVNLRLD